MEPTIYNTTARVNVRTAPTLTAKVADVLNAGQPVNIVQLHDGWAETSESEFVMIDFLQEQPVQEQPADPEETVDHEASE